PDRQRRLGAPGRRPRQGRDRPGRRPALRRSVGAELRRRRRPADRTRDHRRRVRPWLLHGPLGTDPRGAGPLRPRLRPADPLRRPPGVIAPLKPRDFPMDRLQIAADWTAARLHSLRAEMDQNGPDGFIIPRWDAHQSEYVVIADERLAWATGFSGTWGLAIVTRDRAALFVDGRYTVQAQAEVSSAHFEQRHLYDEPLDRWLAEHAVE